MASYSFEKNLNETAQLIRKAKKIIIACHMNPDGDALGSLLGLGIALRRIKKKVILLCPDKVPSRYIALPCARQVRQKYSQGADVAISVDCGSLAQLSRLEQAFHQSRRIIEIDHHEYRTRFGDIQLVDRKKASVGEIIYLLARKMRIKITKPVAECLLTSMLVETCSFSRPDVKESTFEICSHLMQSGADFMKISNHYYWKKKLSVLRLSGLCFVRIRISVSNQLAWSILTQKDFEDYQGGQEDVDSVPDDMLTIDSVQVTLLFREIDNNMLRVSLRSKGKIDVGYLASIYGGGGHQNVGGCRIHNNKKMIERFIEQAGQLIQYKKTIPIHPAQSAIR